MNKSNVITGVDFRMGRERRPERISGVRLAGAVLGAALMIGGGSRNGLRDWKESGGFNGFECYGKCRGENL